MKVAKQAAVRSELYSLVGTTIEGHGFVTETVSDGMLIHLNDGYYAKLKISLCDPTKFNIEDAREAYAQKMAEAAVRAEKARQKAEEKERKAKDKAVKAAEKTPEE